MKDEDEKTLASASSAPLNLSPGSIFADKYEILSFIDSGGMGSVYLVKHLMFNKSMALKLLHAPEATSPEVFKRFQQEALAAFSLNHKNLVRVFDMGVSVDGQPFFTMEYIKGITLGKFQRQNGAFEPNECVKIMLQLCDGLKVAHSAGIVHRDIKPANIMFVDSDVKQVKILDFGIAKIFAEPPSAALTLPGDLIGSPAYMSPEQVTANWAIDERTDIYSLGCVLFEMLTGKLPHVGNNAMQTIMMRQTKDAPSIQSVSPEKHFSQTMTTIVAKMLQRRPEDRFQNITELELQFQKLSKEKAGRQRKVLLSVTAITLCCALTAAFTYFNGLTRSSPAPRVEESNMANFDAVDQSKILDALPAPVRQKLDVFLKAHPDLSLEFYRANDFGRKGNWHMCHGNLVAFIQKQGQDIAQKRQSIYDLEFCSMAYSLIAMCLMKEGHFAEAQRHLDAAITYKPGIRANYILQSNLYRLTKNEQLSASWLEKAKQTKSAPWLPSWAEKQDCYQIP